MTIQRHHVGKRLADMVVHGGTIYLAGQVADDLNADITTQARQVLARIDRLLAEAGSGKDRMLSATIYLPDMADFAAMNAVWEAWIVARTGAGARDRAGEACRQRLQDRDPGHRGAIASTLMSVPSTSTASLPAGTRGTRRRYGRARCPSRARCSTS